MALSTLIVALEDRNHPFDGCSPNSLRTSAWKSRVNTPHLRRFSSYRSLAGTSNRKLHSCSLPVVAATKTLAERCYTLIILVIILFLRRTLSRALPLVDHRNWVIERRERLSWSFSYFVNSSRYVGLFTRMII